VFIVQSSALAIGIVAMLAGRNKSGQGRAA